MHEVKLFNIDTSKDQLTVSARELHEFLESKERFSKWFERMISYGFEEGKDYTPYQKVHPQNQQVILDYQLTIDMGKEISMLQRNDKGKQARKYFIDLENAWNTPERIMHRALQVSTELVHKQKLQIEEMKPKALFADAVSTSETSILIGDLAKLIKQNGVAIGKGVLLPEAIIDMVHPVGSIFESTEERNPSEFLGGVWEVFGAGRVTVGVDTTQTEFNTAGKVGGSKTHTLTVAQMPSHGHEMAVAGDGVLKNTVPFSWRESRFASAFMDSVGGGQPHNNLQPYIVVYRYRRIE